MFPRYCGEILRGNKPAVEKMCLKRKISAGQKPQLETSVLSTVPRMPSNAGDILLVELLSF